MQHELFRDKAEVLEKLEYNMTKAFQGVYKLSLDKDLYMRMPLIS